MKRLCKDIRSGKKLFIGKKVAISGSTGGIGRELCFYLAAMGANIAIAVAMIGVVTFLFSFVGAAAGARIGSRFSTKAQIAGGVVLIALGIKILVENFVG